MREREKRSKSMCNANKTGNTEIPQHIFFSSSVQICASCECNNMNMMKDFLSNVYT